MSRRLGLRVLREQAIVTAGGRREVWPVAEVRIALEGREAPTVCFIAPAGPALLGAVALETLSLGVDPVARRLVPVDGFVLAGPEPAPPPTDDPPAPPPSFSPLCPRRASSASGVRVPPGSSPGPPGSRTPRT